MKSNFIKTNGIRLHYVTEGQGKLMLMLHGFPEFWYSWRYQIEEFSQNYQVVAVDLRGYNDSDKPTATEAYQISELIADVKGVISGLGFAQCILVGHDWGGAIAWNFVYAYPDMVEKLIVMNIPHPAKFAAGLRNPEQLLKSWYVFFFQLPILPEFFVQFNDYQFIESAFRGMAIDKTVFPEEVINKYKDAMAKRGASTATINYYRNIWQGEFFQEAKHWGVLEIPTLMIWGEQDTALGKELTYGTEQYVSDLTLKYIPDCSHWVQQEKPQLVNKYIKEFLAEC